MGVDKTSAGEPAGTIDLGRPGRQGIVLDGAFLDDTKRVPTMPIVVSSGGDLNGDRVNDFLVTTQVSARPRGGILVFFGGPEIESLTKLDGPGPGVGFITPSDAMLLREARGGSMDAVGTGDLNGDGLGDVLVSISIADRTVEPTEGKAFFLWGSRAWEGQTVVLDDEVDSPAWLRVEAKGVKLLGESDLRSRPTASLGDFNGDGMPDFAFVAREADFEGRSMAGRVYVLYWREEYVRLASLDLEDLGDSLPGFMAYGEGPAPASPETISDLGDQAGSTVAAAGDVNGDGLADLLVGAERRGRLDTGFVYLVFGTPDMPARLDLGQLGSRGVRLRGPRTTIAPGKVGEVIGGQSADGVGDINGDGFDDFLLGYPGNCCLISRPTVGGRAYLVYGGPGLPEDMDLPAEAERGNARVVTFEDAVAGDQAGRSVAAAGDVSCDGIPDLLIGAFKAERDGVDGTGAAYVVFGGPHLRGRYSLADVPSRLPGLRILGERFLDFVGDVVAAPGDINGDGRPDIALGTLGLPSNVVNDHAGRLHVLLSGRGRELTADIVTPGFGTHLGGYDVSVLGSGFTEPGPIFVHLGGVAVEAQAVSGSELRVHVPPSDKVGFVDVEVRRGGEWISLQRGFEYTMELQKVDLAVPSPGVTVVRDRGSMTRTYADHLVGGDFDGDGFSDSVLVVSRDDGTRITVVRGRDGLDGLVFEDDVAAAGNGWSMILDAQESDNTVITGLAALDLNGDGFQDLAVGVQDSSASTVEPLAYVVFGRASFPGRLSLTQDFERGQTLIITFPDLVPNLEQSVQVELNVAAAGDQDGDGFADLALGVPADSVTGSLYVVHGRREWPSELVLPAAEGVTRIIGDVQPFLGRDLAGAGDFDGDGLADIVAAAYRRETGVADGNVYVIPGSREAGGNRDLLDLVTSGKALRMQFDFALTNFKDVYLAGGGDLNGDGYDDVLVGLKGTAGFRGEVYAVWGGSPVPPPGDLREVVNTRGSVIVGEMGGDYLSTVAMLGDFDADGIGDALLGAPGSYGPVVDAPGRAYVILGALEFPAKLELDRIGGRGIRIDGVVGSGGFGYRLAAAGDVDGDGAADLLIGENGDYGEDGVPARFGNAYIVRSAYGVTGFRRGDANSDGRVDLSDAIAVLGYLFLGQSAPACADGADSDDSGDINISDAIRVLTYLFAAAEPPPAPGPEDCGVDPTAELLGCEFYSCL